MQSSFNTGSSRACPLPIQNVVRSGQLGGSLAVYSYANKLCVIRSFRGLVPGVHNKRYAIVNPLWERQISIWASGIALPGSPADSQELRIGAGAREGCNGGLGMSVDANCGKKSRLGKMNCMQRGVVFIQACLDRLVDSSLHLDYSRKESKEEQEYKRRPFVCVAQNKNISMGRNGDGEEETKHDQDEKWTTSNWHGRKKEASSIQARKPASPQAGTWCWAGGIHGMACYAMLFSTSRYESLRVATSFQLSGTEGSGRRQLADLAGASTGPQTCQILAAKRYRALLLQDPPELQQNQIFISGSPMPDWTSFCDGLLIFDQRYRQTRFLP
ncbi:hypothetical protein HYFRA_00005853 [Hymenoscyphus fraxineus]|uniref:Uncharacterized protein n=1 Tax=Hymenoscyphus fraxineus TaxID=746836 RepID=A0A9N9PT81_9HELO|nr:hypothetical protein HYFRA_00005853 [Hymenoscyphus fraxineus]